MFIETHNYIHAYIHTCICTCSGTQRLETYITSFIFAHAYTHIPKNTRMYNYLHVCAFLFAYICRKLFIHTEAQVSKRILFQLVLQMQPAKPRWVARFLRQHSRDVSQPAMPLENESAFTEVSPHLSRH